MTRAMERVGAGTPTQDKKGSVGDVVAAIRSVLAVDDDALDYCYAKLLFDRLIEPTYDSADALAQLERMEEEARRLAGPGASADQTFAALRRLVYDAGPWNGARAFAYDQDDPIGQSIRNKLLGNYLATRRGNPYRQYRLYWNRV